MSLWPSDIIILTLLPFCAVIIASSSSSIQAKIAPKPVDFKYKGALKKSRFQDKHIEIRDTKLGHNDQNVFLTLCNNPKERSAMVFSLIQSGLVNATSHPISVQSFELIMTLAQHYILGKRS